MVTAHAADAAQTAAWDDGIYLPSEVSSYLLVTMPAEQHPPTSRRIMRWIRAGLVAPERKDAPGRDIVITFEDLVTCQAVTLLREAGFSLEAIRKTETYFAEHYGTLKPFAHRDFWHAKPDMFGLVDGQFVSGSSGGQITLEFLARWLRPLNARLGFSQESGRADYWQPGRGISLRPTVQFGQPCLEGTRIPTGAIWSYVHAGDSPEFIARAYGLRVDDVERAVRWEERRRAKLDASTAVPAG
jgi:uncharacterized protein (DUF433 family)